MRGRGGGSPSLVVGAWCAAALALCACGRDQPPAEPDPSAAAPVPAAPAAPALDEAPEPAAPRRPPSITQPGELPTPTARVPGDAEGASAAADGTTGQADDEPERDYARELKNAVGDLSGCIEPRAQGQGPERIAISLTATVIDSGRVTRSSMAGASLTQPERACIEKRLGDARLPPNVTEAPRSVSTTYTLEFKQPPKAP